MLRVLLIDDEPNSAETLRLLLTHVPGVEVVGVCTSAHDGLAAITDKSPDLVFLDIEMPHLNGFDLLDSVGTVNFSVIFTTAYNHYAIRAIRFSALDYLLKPIDLAELQQAVARAQQQKELQHSMLQYRVFFENLKNQSQALNKLALPTQEGLLFVQISEIIRCESDRNYTHFHLTSGRPVLVSKNLGEYDELLDTYNFFRVHNSHLVNLAHVRRYLRTDGGQLELTDGSIIDISRRRKDELLARLGL